MSNPGESTDSVASSDGTADVADADPEEKTYGGLFGAFPYAFRQSESYLFKSYVVIGGLLTAFIGLAFTLSVMVVIGQTGSSATLDFSRVFVALIGLFVVFPMLAPVLLVARRHRRRIGTDPVYDGRLAATGYLFVFSLYVGLIPTVGDEYQTEAGGPLGPVIDFLYALPAAVGIAFPIVAATVMYLAHRRLR